MDENFHQLLCCLTFDGRMNAKAVELILLDGVQTTSSYSTTLRY
jgi:hypothetical protein